MQEIWKPCKPFHAEIIKKSHIVSISDDYEDLIIFLSNNKGSNVPWATITFLGPVSSYTALEGDFINGIKISIAHAYGESFLKSYSFFEIENSLYLDWVSKQSLSIIGLPYDKHFCIVLDCFIIHAIASNEPRIDLLPQEAT